MAPTTECPCAWCVIRRGAEKLDRDRSAERFARRLANAEQMADVLEQEKQQTLADLRKTVARLSMEVHGISRTLATFYRAPLSMSSVQPILTLAEELNPGLREEKR